MSPCLIDEVIRVQSRTLPRHNLKVVRLGSLDLGSRLAEMDCQHCKDSPDLVAQKRKSMSKQNIVETEWNTN